MKATRDYMAWARVMARQNDELASGTAVRGHNIYTGNVSMPRALFLRAGGFDPAFDMEQALQSQALAVLVKLVAVVPHLLGSFLGLILLAAAGWRGRSLPRIPLVLLVAFLLWDFLLPPVGPLEAHLLLLISFGWLGVHVARMSWQEWSGTARAGTY